MSGAGTWAGEVCCSGTVQVVGTATDGGITLDLTHTATAGIIRPPFTQRFTGRLTDANTLAGTLTQGGNFVDNVTYRRE